jgi:hypothetical protein
LDIKPFVALAKEGSGDLQAEKQNEINEFAAKIVFRLPHMKSAERQSPTSDESSDMLRCGRSSIAAVDDEPRGRLQ